MEENILENREQPETVNSQVANANVEETGENLIEEGSLNLGKFKGVEELKKAYEALQSQFTKKCQRLSVFEKQKSLSEEDNAVSEKESDNILEENTMDGEMKSLQNTENENTQNNAENAPDYLNENWNCKVDDFFKNTPKAKPFAYEIAMLLSSDKVLASMPNSLEFAYNKVLANHYKSENDYLQDEHFIESVLNNEKITQAVIKKYLKLVQKNMAPVMMSQSFGASVGLSNKSKPKDLNQARIIAERMFKTD